MLDVLSSLPYDHVTLPWRRLPGNNSHYVVILLNIAPAIKLTRYYTLHSNIHYLFTVMFSHILITMIYIIEYFLFQHLEIENFYLEMFTTLLLGLYLIFWFSCLCYLIPILVMYLVNIPPIVSVYTILNYAYF